VGLLDAGGVWAEALAEEVEGDADAEGMNDGNHVRIIL
jgi:hypothetical protein